MLVNVSPDIWFDNEKLFIIKGEENKKNYLKNYDFYPNCVEKKKIGTYKPTIIYMSSLGCNLRCKYCFASDGSYGDKHVDRLFTFENYVKTFDYFYKKYEGINAISFFGGEPLLNFEEIKKFVVYLHENYNREEIPPMAISSNGTIMTEEIKDFLKKYSIGLGTSLDGPKHLNDQLRIGDVESVHDKVVETLNYISDLDIEKVVQVTISKPHIENYKDGDAIEWLREIEQLPVNRYELVPVISNDENLRIDLENEDIKNKFINFCNDFSKHLIYRLENKEDVAISNLPVGTALRIFKREYLKSCGAGKSFAITPDMVVYPCHSFADKPEFGVKFNENFEESLKNNAKFASAKNCNRCNVDKCRECIAKNICSYWCKGFSYGCNNDFNSVLEQRCVLLQIFVRNLIIYLTGRYRENTKQVNKNIYEYSGIVKDEIA